MNSCLIVVLIGIVSTLEVERTVQNIADPDHIKTEDENKLMPGKRTRRNALRDPNFLWPNAQVFYIFAATIRKFSRTIFYSLKKVFYTAYNDRILIKYAFSEIERFTCVRFIEGYSPYYYHHVLITNYINMDCMSDVGYCRLVGQRMNLGPTCGQKGLIMHEALHTLGFHHQHRVPERDYYVDIYWQNIIEANKKDFEKLTDSVVTSLGFPYDYASIMHYGPLFFSRNGQVVLRGKRSGSQQIGLQRELSGVDIAKINILYRCQTNYYNYG